jgi:protein-S-isoprenylcysteine O-methyltransferase
MSEYAKLLGRYSFYLAVTVVSMLLGWGVRDVGGFFREPARSGYVALAVLATLAVLIPRLTVHPFSKGAQVVGSGLLRAYMATGYVLLVLLPFADRRSLWTFPDSELLRWIGVALSVLGTAIRLAGLGSLGRQFSGHVTLQEDHQLVQTGPYRHVRHPMYLGFAVATAGLVLVFRSWLVFPVLVWNLIFVLTRIHQEERLLGEHFATEFDSYRRRTWRLVPFVY